MFTFSEMLALVESESSFVAYVCHRRPAGLQRDQRSLLRELRNTKGVNLSRYAVSAECLEQ